VSYLVWRILFSVQGLSNTLVNYGLQVYSTTTVNTPPPPHPTELEGGRGGGERGLGMYRHIFYAELAAIVSPGIDPGC
jgi:hypothetical protein